MNEPLTQIPRDLQAVQDHARAFAGFTLVYPVISRRSRGLSIGINLNPDQRCNFYCIYCEVDRQSPPKVSRLDLKQLREELVAMIRLARNGGLAKDPKFNQIPWLTRSIKDLAFSGDGEPTLVHNFSACVQVVAEVKRAEHLPRTKIVLITDAAGLNKADVKRGLKLMDANNGEVWAKLDAGTEGYFHLINRSAVRFERILMNLRDTAQKRPIVIQSLFMKVNGDALPSEELDAYCGRLRDIVAQGGQIKEVHAYTVARPTAERSVTRLSSAELERVAGRIRSKTALRVLTFA